MKFVVRTVHRHSRKKKLVASCHVAAELTAQIDSEISLIQKALKCAKAN